jgi:transposase
MMGKICTSRLQFVCSDMWKPYLNVIKLKAPQAVHVLDRFHIAMNMSKAINKVRAEEVRELKAKGFMAVLKHMRFCLLKRPENLTVNQKISLRKLLTYNLWTMKAYLLKEQFQVFWTYHSTHHATAFFNSWTTMAMRSRIEPMKRVARSLRSHWPLILNWFRARGIIALGAVEGLNNKLKVITRCAYRFWSFRKV